MAVSRLLLLQKQPVNHFYRRGPVKLTRGRYCSSLGGKNEKLSHLEKSEAGNEKKTDVKTGGSWYALKGMFTTLQGKLLGYAQLPKQIIDERPNSKVDLTGSEAIMTRDNQRTAAIGETKGVIQSSEVTNNAHHGKKNVSTSTPSHLLREDFSKDTVHMRSFDVRKTIKNAPQSSEALLDCFENEKVTNVPSHKPGENLGGSLSHIISKARMRHNKPDTACQSSEALMDPLRNEKMTNLSSSELGRNSDVNLAHTISEICKRRYNSDDSKLCETGNIVQSLEASMVSFSNGKNVAANDYNLTRENSSEELMKLEDTSGRDNVRLVGPQNGHNQFEEAISGRSVGLGRNQETEAEHLTCSTHQVLDKASSTLEKDSSVELASNGDGNCQPEKSDSYVHRLLACAKVDEIPVSSVGSQNIEEIAALFSRTKHNLTVGDLSGERGESKIPSQSMDNLDGPSRDHAAGGSDMNCLIECIRRLPPLPVKSQESPVVIVTDQVSNRGSTKMMPVLADLQNSDAKMANVSLKARAVGKANKKRKKSSTENEEGQNLNVAADYQLKSIPNSDVEKSYASLKANTVGKKSNRLDVVNTKQDSRNKEGCDVYAEADDAFKSELLPTREEVTNQTIGTSAAEESAEQRSLGNKVLVRFLRKRAERNLIQTAFQQFGPIVKIEELSPVKGSCFKDAFVYFKYEKAMQKALTKTDLTVGVSDVTVEATTLEDGPCNISIPNLIGDPDVPLGLVQNPTRTVKIKELASDTSPRHLKEALSFCGGHVVGCFLDSSCSVAYVVFETEDAKERAIAGHCINVSGTRLPIFRIDTPRTTVVRLSNIDPEAQVTIGRVCSFYGQVKNVFHRTTGIADIHFKLAEWPNMLNILNSMNGLLVGKRRLIAQPAPVIPQQILKVLWSQPDERRHVEAVIWRLVRNLCLDEGELSELANRMVKSYGD